MQQKTACECKLYVQLKFKITQCMQCKKNKNVKTFYTVPERHFKHLCRLGLRPKFGLILSRPTVTFFIVYFFRLKWPSSMYLI